MLSSKKYMKESGSSKQAKKQVKLPRVDKTIQERKANVKRCMAVVGSLDRTLASANMQVTSFLLERFLLLEAVALTRCVYQQEASSLFLGHVWVLRATSELFVWKDSILEAVCLRRHGIARSKYMIQWEGACCEVMNSDLSIVIEMFCNFTFEILKRFLEFSSNPSISENFTILLCIPLQ